MTDDLTYQLHVAENANTVSARSDESDPVFSYAYNVDQMFSGEVNTQTGQYVFQISLIEAVANNLLGPEFTLSLTINQQSTQNMGFGRGVIPNLTTLDLHNGLLRLPTGESIKFDLDGLSENQKAPMLDARIEDIHLQKINENTYEVHYITGEVESLTAMSRNSDRLQISKRYSNLDKSNKYITYYYDDYDQLYKIKDSTEVIWFERSDSAKYSYEFTLINQRLIFHIFDENDYEIKFSKPDSPSENSPIWTLVEYEDEQGFPQRISKVSYHYGRLDIITYSEDVLLAPPEANLVVSGTPAVFRIQIQDLNQKDQPIIKHTEYDYDPLGNGNNYLGYQAESSNEEYDSYSDYLCSVEGEYFYSVAMTEHSLDGSANRITTNTYDKYHNLVISEVVCGECRKTTTTDYFLVAEGYDVSFYRQDVRCKLAKRQEETYEDNTALCKQAMSYNYDDYGNILLQLDEQTGLRTEYTYFDKDGEQGCPRSEFVCFPKTKRIWHPTDRITQTTLYTYQLVPGSNYNIVPLTETYVEGLESSHYDYDENGRVSEERHQLDNHITTILYSYEQQAEVLTKSISRSTSSSGSEIMCSALSLDALTGATLFKEEQALRISYTYYLDGRVSTESVDEEGAYEAKKTYTYDDENHSGTVTDSVGTQIRSTYDALSRPITRNITLQSDIWPDINEFLLEEKQYNGLGQCISGTRYDVVHPNDPTYSSQPSLSLSVTVTYDGWGSKLVTYPDRQEQEYENPASQIRYHRVIGQPFEKVQTSPDQRTQVTTFCDAEGSVLSQECAYLDGLGRTLLVDDKFGGTTRYFYDAFDRVKSKNYNGQRIELLYSEYSSDELTTEIKVDGRSVGTQRFDGFLRLVNTGVDPRQFRYEYQDGQMYTYQRHLPNGHIQPMTYVPQLRCYEAVADKIFRFDTKSGFCIRADKGEQCTAMSYRFDNLVQTEQDNDQQLTYWYSLLGKPTAIVSDTNLAQTYLYNSLGQVEQVNTLYAGQMVASTCYEYDSTGRTTVSTTTHEGTSQTKSVNWDEYPRSITLTTAQSDQETLLEILNFNGSGLLTARRYDLGDNLSCTESYTYDLFGRLKEWQVDGSLAPVDGQGRTLSGQSFEYDTFNNLKNILTSFYSAEPPESKEYYYADEHDPCRLTLIEVHTDTGDVSDWFIPEYDDFGNMLNDEIGTEYFYDNEGLLCHVSPQNQESTGYLYDALDRLSQISPPGQSSVTRHFSNGTVFFELQDNYLRHYQRHVGEKVVSQCVFNQTDNSIVHQIWYQSNAQGSPIQSINGEQVQRCNYSPYGEQHQVNTP
ncbi:hypothetical protein DU976_19315 [Vibrio navarrensis]|nr:hypothetical protein [Vibrio navarrensis]EKA5638280.1 hypothetical protein [Vibrio navarrensis]